MHIATYHIDNVLRAYSKQLGTSKRTAQYKDMAEPNRTDSIDISANAKGYGYVDQVWGTG